MKKILIAALVASSLGGMGVSAPAAAAELTQTQQNAICTAQIPLNRRQDSKNAFYGVGINAVTSQVGAPVVVESEHVSTPLGESSLNASWEGPYRNGGADEQVFKVSFYTSETTAGELETWTVTTTTTYRQTFGCAVYNKNNNLVGPEYQGYTGASAPWDVVTVEEFSVETPPETLPLDPWVRVEGEGTVLPICQRKVTGKDKVVSYQVKSDYAGEFGACDGDLIDNAPVLAGI